MTQSKNTYNQSIEQLKIISQRIATLANKLREEPSYAIDYKNALEVVVLLLNKEIDRIDGLSD